MPGNTNYLYAEYNHASTPRRWPLNGTISGRRRPLQPAVPTYRRGMKGCAREHAALDNITPRRLTRFGATICRRMVGIAAATWIRCCAMITRCPTRRRPKPPGTLAPMSRKPGCSVTMPDAR